MRGCRGARTVRAYFPRWGADRSWGVGTGTGPEPDRSRTGRAGERRSERHGLRGQEPKAALHLQLCRSGAGVPSAGTELERGLSVGLAHADRQRSGRRGGDGTGRDRARKSLEGRGRGQEDGAAAGLGKTWNSLAYSPARPLIPTTSSPEPTWWTLIRVCAPLRSTVDFPPAFTVFR